MGLSTQHRIYYNAETGFPCCFPQTPKGLRRVDCEALPLAPTKAFVCSQFQVPPMTTSMRKAFFGFRWGKSPCKSKLLNILLSVFK